MGYSTDFTGEFNVSPPLKPEHRAYLEQFAEIRHMRRDAVKAEKLPDPLRLAVGLPIGPEGCYYVGTDSRYASQDGDESTLDSNSPPGVPRAASPYPQYSHLPTTTYTVEQPWAQPGLWCLWIPNEDGSAIVWDEGEKFYEYEAWMQYLLDHFLTPWGYMVAGVVYWQGEKSDDMGRLVIDSPTHVVKAQPATISYGP